MGCKSPILVRVLGVCVRVIWLITHLCCTWDRHTHTHTLTEEQVMDVTGGEE